VPSVSNNVVDSAAGGAFVNTLQVPVMLPSRSQLPNSGYLSLRTRLIQVFLYTPTGILNKKLLAAERKGLGFRREPNRERIGCEVRQRRQGSGASRYKG
jgi:hypothetical protein